jgi:hypothetical protein
MAADPVVYFTGSTAFRSTIYTSLADNNGDAGAVFQAGTITFGTWGNSAPASANYMVFHGKLASGPDAGQSVYIDCAWSGSEAGIASVCQTTLGNTDRNGNFLALAGSPETWVDYTTATLAAAPAGNVQGGNPGANGSPANGAQLEASSHGGDLAQADTSQAISWNPDTGGLTHLVSYGSEGVVTFTVTRNVNPAPNQAYLDCTNISLPQLQVLTANGVAPASFITGNPADNVTAVYLVGRNLGSGTRMNYLGDSQYGAHNPVNQNSIGYGCGDPGDPAQEPTVLILNPEGNNGYESGGGVAKALADTGASSTSGSCQQADPNGNGANWFAIGYLSPSDALSTGNNGGQTPPLNPGLPYWLTVDGFISNNQNIENGPWWYWGHEMLYGKNGITGIQDATGTVLENAVAGEIGLLNLGVTPAGHDAAIPYSLMNVTKGSDTAFPSF